MNSSYDDIIARYASLDRQPPEALLTAMAREFEGAIVFTTSLGMEDQVITDMILRERLPIEITTIDTGRLHEETYKVLDRTNRRYGAKIGIVAPEAADIERMVTTKGPLSFYESIENRKECCHYRKVKPLDRALAGKRCWITGIRAEQSTGRSRLSTFTHDEERGVLKCQPLLHWSSDDVRRYIHDHDVPYNSLHDRGYPSIGCAPCTRAIREGEDERAGRWWWENDDTRECGLHER